MQQFIRQYLSRRADIVRRVFTVQSRVMSISLRQYTCVQTSSGSEQSRHARLGQRSNSYGIICPAHVLWLLFMVLQRVTFRFACVQAVHAQFGSDTYIKLHVGQHIPLHLWYTASLCFGSCCDDVRTAL